MPIPAELFDEDGELDLDHIFCSKCRGNESDEVGGRLGGLRWVAPRAGTCMRGVPAGLWLPAASPRPLRGSLGCRDTPRRVTGWCAGERHHPLRWHVQPRLPR